MNNDFITINLSIIFRL